MSRVLLMRKAHAMAKELFGTAEIDGAPAYVYFLKRIIRIMFGKDSRAQLNQSEWEILCAELEKYTRLKRGRALPENRIEIDDEPTNNTEDA